MTLFQVENSDGVLIVYFAQPKLVEEAPMRQIGDDLLALAADAEQRKMLLDFRGVVFISSAFLGQIVRLSRRCQSENISLRVCNLAKHSAEVFRITGLSGLFKVCKDQPQALADFK